jgi:hypothetical protein
VLAAAGPFVHEATLTPLIDCSIETLENTLSATARQLRRHHMDRAVRDHLSSHLEGIVR